MTIRRQVAIALEKLIVDGRIHLQNRRNGRKSTKRGRKYYREEGEKAIFDTGILGLHSDLIRYIGNLNLEPAMVKCTPFY